MADATTGQTAGHGLKVHDAQRLVDARADESVAAVLQSVQLRLRQHFLDPHDVATLLVQLGERDLDLFGDFRGGQALPRTAPPEYPWKSGAGP